MLRSYGYVIILLGWEYSINTFPGRVHTKLRKQPQCNDNSHKLYTELYFTYGKDLETSLHVTMRYTRKYSILYRLHADSFMRVIRFTFRTTHFFIIVQV